LVATLKFLLINLRWFGGAGFRTLEQRMEEAVRRLPTSWDLLAELLIEVLEIQDRDEASKKVDARILLNTLLAPTDVRPTPSSFADACLLAGGIGVRIRLPTFFSNRVWMHESVYPFFSQIG
jgi:hypothetical protein